MTDDLDVLSRLLDYHDHIAAPAVPVADDVRRGRQRVVRRRAATTAAAAAVAVAGVVLTSALVTGGDGASGPQPVEQPSRTHRPTKAVDPVEIPTGPSEVLGARQLGRYRMEVGGEVLPGRWSLDQNRRDVWTAAYFDDVGYMSPALWWGKGTTTHEVPGQRGGVAISEDGHWIVWTRATEGGYDGVPSSPRVMEVVDTATGEVRWSRDAGHDAPEIAALAVTNDGVVVFGYCMEPTVDIGGTPQCDDARIDVWAPRSGRTETVPTEVTVERGPAGTVPALTPLVQAEGMPHDGLLVRDTPSAEPRFVRVSADGDVEVVATLPRATAAVTADGRFALVANECADAFRVCSFSAQPLDGGPARPVEAPESLVRVPTDYDLPVFPYVVEQDDLVVVRDVGDYRHSFRATLRCSLAEARCVRVEE